jgi:hypothetical protein
VPASIAGYSVAIRSPSSKNAKASPEELLQNDPKNLGKNPRSLMNPGLEGAFMTSVLDLAGRHLQADIHYLKAGQVVGSENHEYSTDESRHFAQITDPYIAQHPLGFLAKTSGYWRSVMTADAVRRDLALSLDVCRREMLQLRQRMATANGVVARASDDECVAVIIWETCSDARQRGN